MAKVGKSASIAISKIVRCAETQMRTRINDDVIERYAAERKAGAKFPDVVVFGPDENGVYVLADGFHTVAAYEKVGETKIGCTVYAGGLRDAILHSVGANAAHGLPRTEADRTKAVMTLLSDKEWSKKPQEWIAKMARVRKQLVGDVKKDMADQVLRARGETPPPRPERKEPERKERTPAADKPSKSLEPVVVGDSDRYRQPIPDKVKPAASYAGPAHALAKEIRDLLPRLASLHKSPGGVKMAHISVEADLKRAAEGIERSVFECVCPVCGGDGSGEKKNSHCPTCTGRGWLDRNGVAALPQSVANALKAKAAG